MRQHYPPRLHTTNLEVAYVEAPSIAFTITPVSATVEFPNNVHLAHKYRHLDLAIMDMTNEYNFTGIFPQLWGLQPITPEVKAMKTSPSKRYESQSCPQDHIKADNEQSGRLKST